jgi:hypothetical protein
MLLAGESRESNGLHAKFSNKEPGGETILVVYLEVHPLSPHF